VPFGTFPFTVCILITSLSSYHYNVFIMIGMNIN